MAACGGKHRRALRRALIALTALVLLLSLCITAAPRLDPNTSLPGWSRIFSAAGLLPGQPEGESVHVLNVGQGTAVLVISGGHAMLVDAGPGADGGRTVTRYLRQMGVERLDLVIATHAHEDHIGALSAVVQKFPVERLVMSQTRPEAEEDAAAYDRVRNACADRGITPTAPRAGMRYTVGGFAVELLYADAAAAEENNRSAVTRITDGKSVLLLMGDAEQPVEEALITSGTDLRADILVAGHHGSKTSTTSAFLQAVRPGYVVFSAGEDNSFGHPAPEVLDRAQDCGARCLRTDVNGTVVFRLWDGKRTLETEW